MMTTVQLREQVVEKIYGINDQEYLKAIDKILDMNPESEKIFALNNEQKALVNLGKRQIADGEYIANEELEAEEDRWLNE